MKNTFLCLAGLALTTMLLPVQAQPGLPPEGTSISTIDQSVIRPDSRFTEREQAVQLARNQHYGLALTVLQALYTGNPADRDTACDYIAVLNWAGRHTEAVSVFEALAPGPVPAYVLRAAGGSYYQTGRYAEALPSFKMLTAQGDSQAELWQAECLAALGDTEAAAAFYQERLAKTPADSLVYLSRARTAGRQGNYRQAAADYERARTLIAGDSAQAIVLQDELTIALLRSGNILRAIAELQPYIENGSANTSMQGNYIVALRSSGQYRQAVETAGRLWPDNTLAPLFALRAAAESYSQLKEPRQAITLYQAILARQPHDDSAQMGLAYHLLATGQQRQGLTIYTGLLDHHPTHPTLAVNDAVSLLTAGHRTAASALFQTAIAYQPDLRERYAAALRTAGMPQAALEQYRLLAGQAEASPAVLAGWLRTALSAGDYRQARQARQQLYEQFPLHPLTAAATEAFASRPLGEASLTFRSDSSYKQKDSAAWSFAASQNLSDSYRLSAGYDRLYLSDQATRRTLSGRNIGLRFANWRTDTQLVYTRYTDTLSAYSLASEYRLSDNTAASLTISRSPLTDVRALAAQAGPVLVQNYQFALTRRPSSAYEYSLSVSRSLFSDSNQATGFSLRHTQLLYDRVSQALSRQVYWNRTFYKEEHTAYDSPDLRESLGLGFHQKFSRGPEYVAVDWMLLNWEHDVPERLALTPYIRLEYGYDMSATYALALGVEYGLHSDNAAGAGLRYSYRRLDGAYRIRW